jgi:3-methyladenine DNA glycosylase AlkD
MKKQRLTAEDAKRTLRKYADPKAAQFLAGFCKTGPGQYAAGDKFLGIKVPVTRAVAKQFMALPLSQIRILIRSEWHEERQIALVLLVNQFAKGDEEQRKAIYEFYLQHTRYINNWDLVDMSAPGIVGRYLMDHNRAILKKLAVSKLLWERRIAIVSTQYLIRKNQHADTLVLSKILLKDTEDLMHKAVGWMLREVGKRDRQVLIEFLNQHRLEMPRTALRYAIEHFSPKERARFLGPARQT